MTTTLTAGVWLIALGFFGMLPVTMAVVENDITTPIRLLACLDLLVVTAGFGFTALHALREIKKLG